MFSTIITMQVKQKRGRNKKKEGKKRAKKKSPPLKKKKDVAFTRNKKDSGKRTRAETRIKFLKNPVFKQKLLYIEKKWKGRVLSKKAPSKLKNKKRGAHKKMAGKKEGVIGRPPFYLS